MQTIPKSRKVLLNNIFSAATSCREYTLNNQFYGEDVEPKYALTALLANDSAKLRYELVTRQGVETRQYRIYIHSNRWYEIQSPVAPT